MLNLEAIGLKIAQLRKQKNMTQNELADVLYVTHQAVSKWENGKSVPSLEMLLELTKLFDVSIDFILDNSEIDPSDYESQFKYLSREIVISNFLKTTHPEKEIEQFFYLLKTEERFLLINMIIQQKLDVRVESIWPYCTNKERQHLLGTILTNKMDYNVNLLWNHLTESEQRLVEYHVKNGQYNYALYKNKRSVIIERKKSE